MKKYEMTTDTKMILGKKLSRIRALISFGDVEEGELGGYIEKEENLSHEGNAWVTGNAQVSDDACVSGDARVFGNAQVSGDADLLHITGLGTVHRTTTVYRTPGGIEIVCGCFRGNLEQFRKQVEVSRTGKVREEYLKFAELAEVYFEI